MENQATCKYFQPGKVFAGIICKYELESVIIMENIFKAAFVVMAFTGLTDQGSAQTVVDALPYVISSPGNYLLAKNLTLAPSQKAGNAITVNASDVTIDLNGFFITKAESGTSSQSLGIYAINRDNIIVKNGVIANFYIGIQFDYSSGPNINSNHVVDGVTFTREQAYGIVLTQTSNCLIQNCSVENTGFDSAGNIVSGTGIGIELSVASGAANALINNRITKSLRKGIETRTGQALGGTFLEGNLVSRCPVGFDIASSDKYRNNITISCGTPFSASGAIDLGGNN